MPPVFLVGRVGIEPTAPSGICFRDRRIPNLPPACVFINAENLIKTLADISFNNNGFLGGMNAQKAMYNIQQNPFRCWVAEDDKGTVRTYFDEEHANRAFYYISKRKAKQEMYELMKKEREDAEVAQKETAELTKKAKEENNDLPFDM